MAQNKGNRSEMAKAVRSMPHHAFNDHSLCGDWCGFHKNNDYDHSIVPGGLHDLNLFSALKTIFYKLADNAEKFSHPEKSFI